MKIETELKKLVLKYKSDLAKLHIEWQQGDLSFDVYRMDEQYIKGKLSAINDIANLFSIQIAD